MSILSFFYDIPITCMFTGCYSSTGVKFLSLSLVYYFFWNHVTFVLYWLQVHWSFLCWATLLKLVLTIFFKLGSSSVQSPSHVQLFGTPWTAARQASLSITNSQSLLKLTNSCPSSRWCHPTISSSVVPFSSHLQSFPASGSFPMSQFFTPGGQNIGVSALASVFPMNIQDWFPLGWTGCLSL